MKMLKWLAFACTIYRKWLTLYVQLVHMWIKAKVDGISTVTREGNVIILV